MYRKIIFIILFTVIVLAILVKCLTVIILEPWIGGKIQSVWNENTNGCKFKIEKVHILGFWSGIELNNITVNSGLEQSSFQNIDGKITSIKLTGINLVQILCKKEIYIREVNILQVHIKGEFVPATKKATVLLAPCTIRIGTIILNKINVTFKNKTNAQFFTIKDGVMKVNNIQIVKQDTISTDIVKQCDFEASEFLLVSPDSNYLYKLSGVKYAVKSRTLRIKDFSIHPNYSEYAFTSRYKYRTDCINAQFSNMRALNFSAANYFSHGNLISSYIEIGKWNIYVFRDNRKKMLHRSKPTFQDLIYRYPGSIAIDSLSLLQGNIVYVEHAVNANEPGKINFKEIHASIYKITNNLIYKTKKAYFVCVGQCLLMGEGSLNFRLKARIYDDNNTFSVKGTLGKMEMKKLNPMLEKNAFVYVTSGKIDAMNFSFWANNTRAIGKLNLRYHGLDIAVKNKQTDDTTAFREKFNSLLVNLDAWNSNPLPGEKVRVGWIDYKRDREKFLFNYCFKSIFSGIKYSIVKNPKSLKKRNEKQKI